MKSFILVVAMLLVSMNSAVMAQTTYTLEVNGCPGWQEWIDYFDRIDNPDPYPDSYTFTFTVYNPCTSWEINTILNPDMPPELLACLFELMRAAMGCCDPNDPMWPLITVNVTYHWDCCDWKDRWNHHIPSGCNADEIRTSYYNCELGKLTSQTSQGSSHCLGNLQCQACNW